MPRSAIGALTRVLDALCLAAWCASDPGPSCELRMGPGSAEQREERCTASGTRRRLTHRHWRGQRRHDGGLGAAGNARHLRGRGCGAGRSGYRLRRGGGGSRRRAARKHNDAGADLHAVEQVRDILVQHADAARRDELADRRGLVGAMDAIGGIQSGHSALREIFCTPVQVKPSRPTRTPYRIARPPPRT